MLRRSLIIVLCGGLVLALPASAVVEHETGARLVASLQVLRSDEQGVVLQLDTPDYSLTPVQLDGKSFTRLSAPDMTSTAEPGKPQLPQKNVTLGVPAGAQVQVELVEAELVPVSGSYKLSPAPRPAPVSDDLQPGALLIEPDQAAYASAEPYPLQAVRVADDAWLRDQRVVRVELNPFQYNASQGSLLWHRRMRVEVRFLFAASRVSPGSSLATGDNPFEPILRSSLLNYDVARAWREQLGPARSLASQAAPDATPRYKIVVDHDGMYRLTYADLQAAGLDVDHVDPRTFHLTSQAQDVALYVQGEGDGRLDAGDFLIFYGQRFRGDHLAARYAGEDKYWPTLGLYGWQPHFNAIMLEKYTDENVYWLTVGGVPGPRMASVNGSPTGTAQPREDYVATAHAEQKLTTSIQNFTSEDIWFWERINTGVSVTRTYTTMLSAVSSAPYSATIRADVWARFSSAVSPDHHTRFLINDPPVLLEDATWDGAIRHRMQARADQSVLREGVNTLAFNVIPMDQRDEIFFDWFEIEYARRLTAQDDQLFITGVPTGAWQYRAGNLLTETVTVYDVTRPLTPTRVLSPSVTRNGSVFSATFEVSQTLGAQVMVVGDTGLQSPKRVSFYAPPDLSSANGADYIIITHRDFYTASQTLAAYRASQGLRAKVIDVDDLYNQFNDGIFHSIAIKSFLRYTYLYWQKPEPAYVVLVGDGHWNFKHSSFSNYTYRPVFMPPHLAWVDPWQGEIDSSSLLAAVNGDDIYPDLSIGRMPVRTADELSVIISKTMAYEQTGTQVWQRNMLFVADNNDPGAGDFAAASEDLIAHYMPASLQPIRVYLDNYVGPCVVDSPCPPATFALTSTLNLAGALFVNYEGHGYTGYWAREQVLSANDVPTLANLNRLPIILSMTCLDGYWYYPTPNVISLAATLLRAGNGGSVASFSPTGLGLQGGHDVLDRAFFTAVFRDKVPRLGVAAAAARWALFEAGVHPDLVDSFTIFGDPALKLPNLVWYNTFLPVVFR